MNIILHDLEAHLTFAPLTLTRPVGNLRMGIFTNDERWKNYCSTASVSFKTEGYLSGKFPCESKADNFWVNAAVVPNQALANMVSELNSGEALYVNNQFIAYRGSEYGRGARIDKTLEDLIVLKHRWDIFGLNDKVLKNDFAWVKANRNGVQLDTSNQLIGSVDQLFIEEGAIVQGAILNTTTGPIYVGKHAEIMEGSIVRGGLALCEHAVLKLGWSPFCEATCNGSTYAYKVRVLEQIDNNTQVPTNQNGHLVDLTTAHFLWDEDLYVYIPLYQYMTSSEYSSMLANSFGSNQWYEWNTLAHHGLLIEDQYDTDGIKIVEYLNATPGQFRNSQNIKIMEPHVYAVQKSIGYFQFDIQSSHGGATLAPDQCGILVSNTGSDHQDQINEANNFTLYGNTKFTFPSSTQGLPYYNNELFCQNPWSYPGSTGGAVGTGGKWTYDKTGVPLFQYVAGGPSIGDDGVDLFDYMETMFTELRIDDDEDSFINSTGVAWWPGDAVSAVQLYRVDRTGDQLFTSPFTIYRDSLFDENNNLRLFEIETPKGLYNLVLHAEESEVQFPVILEVTQSMSHASSDTKCDRLDVSIFPVPIVDKKFTTQLSLDEKAKLKYTVIDDLGGVHFQRMVNLRENQVHKIPVTTPHLPNGLIFHTFEIENECVRTITTIKNE